MTHLCFPTLCTANKSCISQEGGTHQPFIFANLLLKTFVNLEGTEFMNAAKSGSAALRNCVNAFFVNME